MAVEKKYYSGSQVFDIIKELPDKEFLVMLNAFAKERGANVTEVVHCKNCWKRDNVGFCPLVDDNCYPPKFPDDWFCKDGERRDNECD